MDEEKKLELARQIADALLKKCLMKEIKAQSVKTVYRLEWGPSRSVPAVIEAIHRFLEPLRPHFI